jgi:ribosomal protein S18 acetylase RimI-like enzyme
VAELAEQPFDLVRDLPTLLALVAAGRASNDPHAFLHPGGLQWLLRRLGHHPLEVRQWRDGAALAGAIVDDDGYAMLVSAEPSLDRYLWLLDRAEERRRARGGSTIEVSAWDGDAALLTAIGAHGYARSGTFGHELVNDDLRAAQAPRLPDGFQMRWLEPDLDDACVELHRAAWSDRSPSTYTRELHDAVTAMPDFDRRLVPIVAAPGGTLAAYCISWLDARTRTVEIEPLGTRPEYRRLGLGRAIVDEVLRRAAERDAVSVMVWGAHGNDAAFQLYESAGLRSRRVLREYRRAL